MREHRRSVERDIKPAIGALRLDKLSARDLDQLYRELLGRGLSPASVRRHHSIIHAALDRAVKWGMLAANPADRATPPGTTRSVVSAPSVASVQRLIATAEELDSVLAAAIALGAVRGARRGELCALRWSDIDCQRRTLRIDRSLTALRRIAKEGRTKTRSRRDIAIDDALATLLARRQAEQREYAAKVGTALVENPHLLSRSADGSAPCRPDGLTASYARLAKRLGLSGHLHELRHFAATIAIGSGMDVRTVSGRLGLTRQRRPSWKAPGSSLADQGVLYFVEAGRHDDDGTVVRGVKFATYFDTLGAANGALRFVPCSQHDSARPTSGTTSAPTTTTCPAWSQRPVPVMWSPSTCTPPTPRSVGGTAWFGHRVPGRAGKRGGAREDAALHGRRLEQGFRGFDRDRNPVWRAWLANASGYPRRAPLIERLRTVGLLSLPGAEVGW